MAKKIKFLLEMADGEPVYNLEEFKKHFDAKKAIGYFKDGRLLNWFRSRSYNDEADKIAQLSASDPLLHKNICEIFDVNVDVEDIDVEKITRRTERLNLLRQYTDDKKILEQVDLVAFNQADLDALIDEGKSLIYLCANRFTIPLHVHNKTYVGVGKAIAVILSSGFIIDFDKFNIKFQNIKFDDKYNDVLKTHKLNEEKKLASAQETELKKEVLAKKWCDEGYKALREQDFPTAFQCFKNAAESGNTYGMFNVGLMYYKGEGIPIDKPLALLWFKKAAQAGYINAMINVSMMYENGEGVNADPAQAFIWCKKAADSGDHKAMVNLGRMYDTGMGIDIDKTQAFIWYKKSAEAGNANGMFLVGYMYYEGDGVDVNKNQAFHWFKKSAEAGNIVAMRNVAKCYRNGEGIHQNIARAEYWERKSNET